MSKPFANHQGLPFDDEAMSLIEQAGTEANRLNHNFIGTEHILMAQAKMGEPFLKSVAENLGVTREQILGEILKYIGTGPDQKIAGKIPMTPRVKKQLTLAGKEATAMGSKAVSCVYILLGQMLEGDGVAVRVLKNFGADLEAMRGLARAHLGIQQPPEVLHFPEGVFSSAPEGLSLVVDRGSAPPEVIAEILCDLSLLYRKVGGSGITFSFDEVHMPDEEAV